MSWIRTAISMVTSRFSIYKVFQIELGSGTPRSGRLIGPREFALLMISIGLFSLLMARLQHRHDLNALRAQYADIPRSLGRVVAAMIAILGLLAMIAVIFRQ